MTPPLFHNVAIVGIGLMGGSLGLALKARGLAGATVGVARRPETRDAALARGLVDSATDRIDEAVRGADLVVLATPLLTYEGLLRRALADLPDGCIVTDLGSAKSESVRVGEALLGNTGAAFVGGHPMAGSEESGPEAARADLYLGATWCLTPTPTTDERALGRVRALVEAAGARPLILSPEAHDRAVAATSHVPHLAATALVAALARVAGDVPAALQLTAGGFRDTTRVASGDPEMWRDICLANRAAILDALRIFKEEIEAIEDAIERQDGGAIGASLGAAREIRERVIKPGPGAARARQDG